MLRRIALAAGIATMVAGLLWFLAMAIWPAIFAFYAIGPGLILIGLCICAFGPRNGPMPDSDRAHYDYSTDHDGCHMDLAGRD